MDKYITKFFELLARIAEALEVIAGEEFKKGQPIVNPVLAKEKAERERLEEEAKLELVKAELVRLKIPFAKEMPLNTLQARLAENKEKAEAKLLEDSKPKAHVEPKAPAKPKAPVKPKTPVKPENEKVQEVTEEDMKKKLTELMAEHGDAVVVKYFKEYPFKTPALMITGIALEERAKFMADLDANFSKPASIM